jgi:hypothetical protein
MVLDPFFRGRAVYRSPDPPSGSSHSSISKKQNENQPMDNIPCLKNGVTLQCVDQ